MIVLASASPRRKELLALITSEFEIEVSDVDEVCAISDVRELVCELARRKAEAVFAKRPADTVIGADTVVLSPNGEIFGKPKDLRDARRMVSELSGKAHKVYTGVCIMYGQECCIDACETKVFFDQMEEEDQETYIKTEQVMDKAGAYAIQGGAAKYINRIEGDFFNVVGLPVAVVYKMLKKLKDEKFF